MILAYLEQLIALHSYSPFCIGRCYLDDRDKGGIVPCLDRELIVQEEKLFYIRATADPPPNKRKIHSPSPHSLTNYNSSLSLSLSL